MLINHCCNNTTECHFLLFKGKGKGKTKKTLSNGYIYVRCSMMCSLLKHAHDSKKAKLKKTYRENPRAAIIAVAKP